ncbi:Serine carboxypeptidase S28 family protein [Zea mays]|uniref:Serine carboxypeptidase S28 family protein n=1 Tax=Zea mays TaxID=4577 RepID=A0A1D6JLE0_MAIZE|nr:Serine carboxypeptidase S28 family protein [Zea mays]
MPSTRTPPSRKVVAPRIPHPPPPLLPAINTHASHRAADPPPSSPSARRPWLDHFSFPGVGDEDEAVVFFQQRYLVGRGGGWAGPGGRIFFYCGNEGDIACASCLDETQISSYCYWGLASSAPILQFEDIVPSTIFYDLVSDDFRRKSLSYFLTIKDSWKELDDQANKQDGLLKLSKTFHLCQTLKTSGDLSDWLSSAYSYLAMVDYPLPSEFLRPLPANPIKEVCGNIDSQPKGTGTLERIYAGVNVYYNYTDTVDCFDLNDDPHGMGGWD